MTTTTTFTLPSNRCTLAEVQSQLALEVRERYRLSDASATEQCAHKTWVLGALLDRLSTNRDTLLNLHPRAWLDSRTHGTAELAVLAAIETIAAGIPIAHRQSELRDTVSVAASHLEAAIRLIDREVRPACLSPSEVTR